MNVLAAAYRRARYRVLAAGGWIPLRRLPGGPWALVTAWNPGSRPLPERLNRARDRALAAWLDRHGVAHRRGRSAARDGRWREDGWCIPHRAARTRTLLRRWGQLAACTAVAGREGLCWSGPA